MLRRVAGCLEAVEIVHKRVDEGIVAPHVLRPEALDQQIRQA
jgi:hypothetical protein